MVKRPCSFKHNSLTVSTQQFCWEVLMSHFLEVANFSNYVTGGLILTLYVVWASWLEAAFNGILLRSTFELCGLWTGGIVISVVVGGEVGALRSIEEGCSIIIDEMPIHVSIWIFLFQCALVNNCWTGQCGTCLIAVAVSLLPVCCDINHVLSSCLELNSCDVGCDRLPNYFETLVGNIPSTCSAHANITIGKAHFYWLYWSKSIFKIFEALITRCVEIDVASRKNLEVQFVDILFPVVPVGACHTKSNEVPSTRSCNEATTWFFQWLCHNVFSKNSDVLKKVIKTYPQWSYTGGTTPQSVPHFQLHYERKSDMIYYLYRYSPPSISVTPNLNVQENSTL